MHVGRGTASALNQHDNASVATPRNLLCVGAALHPGAGVRHQPGCLPYGHGHTYSYGGEFATGLRASGREGRNACNLHNIMVAVNSRIKPVARAVLLQNNERNLRLLLFDVKKQSRLQTDAKQIVKQTWISLLRQTWIS